MSRQTQKSYVTPEEYLAFERAAEYKNEYFDGEIVAMTGASLRHNMIAGNIFAEIKRQLKRTDCDAFMNDMRVGVPAARLYTYPDVVAVCGEPKLEDEHLDTLLNPILIVEVLSKSTAMYDRTIKFGYYRTIDTLAEYLLVSQNDFHVEQYAKQADGRWLLTDVRGADGVVEMTSIRCSLPLAEVYDKVAME